VPGAGSARTAARDPRDPEPAPHPGEPMSRAAERAVFRRQARFDRSSEATPARFRHTEGPRSPAAPVRLRSAGGSTRMARLRWAGWRPRLRGRGWPLAPGTARVAVLPVPLAETGEIPRQHSAWLSRPPSFPAGLRCESPGIVRDRKERRLCAWHSPPSPPDLDGCHPLALAPASRAGGPRSTAPARGARHAPTGAAQARVTAKVRSDDGPWKPSDRTVSRSRPRQGARGDLNDATPAQAPPLGDVEEARVRLPVARAARRPLDAARGGAVPGRRRVPSGGPVPSAHALEGGPPRGRQAAAVPRREARRRRCRSPAAPALLVGHDQHRRAQGPAAARVAARHPERRLVRHEQAQRRAGVRPGVRLRPGRSTPKPTRARASPSRTASTARTMAA
jgi:hypothetical protein